MLSCAIYMPHQSFPDLLHLLESPNLPWCRRRWRFLTVRRRRISQMPQLILMMTIMMIMMICTGWIPTSRCTVFATATTLRGIASFRRVPAADAVPSSLQLQQQQQLKSFHSRQLHMADAALDVPTTVTCRVALTYAAMDDSNNNSNSMVGVDNLTYYTCQLFDTDLWRLITPAYEYRLQGLSANQEQLLYHQMMETAMSQSHGIDQTYLVVTFQAISYQMDATLGDIVLLVLDGSQSNIQFHDQSVSLQAASVSTVSTRTTTSPLQVQQRTVLIIRIIATDSAPTLTPTQLHDQTFTKDFKVVSFYTQMYACSAGQIQLVPSIYGNNQDHVPGVLDVPVDVAASGSAASVLVNAMREAALLQLPPHQNGSVWTNIRDAAQHIMVVVPPGITPTFAANGEFGGQQTTFYDEWAGYISATMHELAHNFRLPHGYLNHIEYKDESGYMGWSQRDATGPRKCYNAANFVTLGWYSQRQRQYTNSDLAQWTKPTMITLTAFVDFHQTITNELQDAIVLLQLGGDQQGDTSSSSIAMMYNRAKRHNVDTELTSNQLSITQLTNYGTELLQGVSVGQQFAFQQGNTNLMVEVCLVYQTTGLITSLDEYQEDAIIDHMIISVGPEGIPGSCDQAAIPKTKAETRTSATRAPTTVAPPTVKPTSAPVIVVTTRPTRVPTHAPTRAPVTSNPTTEAPSTSNPTTIEPTTTKPVQQPIPSTAIPTFPPTFVGTSNATTNESNLDVVIGSPIVNMTFVHASNTSIVDGLNHVSTLRSVSLSGWMVQDGRAMLLGNHVPKNDEVAASHHGWWDLVSQVIVENNNFNNLDTQQQRLDMLQTAWLNNAVTQHDIQAIKSAGFDAVRVPLHYKLFTFPVYEDPSNGRDTWLLSGFERLDQVLNWCRKAQLYMILTLQAAPGGQGRVGSITDYDPNKPSLWEDSANERQTIALWKMLAKRYQHEHWIAAYDLLDVPHWSFDNTAMTYVDPNGCHDTTNEPLKNFYQQAITAIRSVDTNHMVIIQGNCFGNNHEGLWPMVDPTDNLALGFMGNPTSRVREMHRLRDQLQIPLYMVESATLSQTAIVDDNNNNIDPFDNIKNLQFHRVGWSWSAWKQWNETQTENEATSIYTMIPPDGYDALIRYWVGGGNNSNSSSIEKPDPDTAYNVLMAFMERSHFTNTINDRVVLDALSKQLSTCPDTTPISLNVINATTTRVEAEDYCDMLGVQNQKSLDIDGGINVGWIDTGDWMQYRIDIPVDGIFDIQVRVSAVVDGGGMDLEVQQGGDGSSDGAESKIVTSIHNLPNTGDWQNWETISSSQSLFLQAGIQTIFITAIQGGWNINWMEIHLNSSSAQ